MRKPVFRGWRAHRNARAAQGAVTDVNSVAAEVGSPPPPEPAPPTRSKGRLWLLLLVCLLGSMAVSFIGFKFVAPRALGAEIPQELVGTWQVTEGDLQGATLEFTWYGSATAVLFKSGKKETTKSSARVVGKVLFLTTRDVPTGAEETVTQTILQLTADELVIRDEDRNVYRMKRIGS